MYTDAPAWLGRGPQQGVFLRAVARDELPETERWAEGERGQVLVAQSIDHGRQLEVFPDFPAAQVPLSDSVHVSTSAHKQSAVACDSWGFSERSLVVAGPARTARR